MAARTRRASGVGTMPQEWKDKIKATKIMQRLQGCIDGSVTLTSQQVKAADILLKKVVPDLARQELTGKDGKDLENPLTDKERKQFNRMMLDFIKKEDK